MPVTSTVKDGLEGYLSLSLLSINELDTPNAPTATASTSGGSIGASTSRWYKIAATDADGESLPSTAGTATTTTGSANKIALTWTVVPNATGYKIYSASASTGPFYFKASTTSNSYDDLNGTVNTTAENPAEWVELGFVTGFNYEENPNDRPIYSHYEVHHYKKGRADATGSISHLYTNRLASVYKMLDFVRTNNKMAGIKLEIKDDGGETVTETHKLYNARFGVARFNQPDQGDITISADFRFKNSLVS